MTLLPTRVVFRLALSVMSAIILASPVLAQDGHAHHHGGVPDMDENGRRLESYDSAPALEVLDIMLYIFGFIYLGTVLSVIYTIRLKTLEGLKSATFVLFIVHLFWTLPDFVSLLSGSSAHPPIIIMVLTLIPVIGLYYVSQKGELKT